MDSKTMYYKISFLSNKEDDLQKRLNQLYNYEKDIITKTHHRNRLNLFFLLVKDLMEKKIITCFDNAIDIGCNAGIYSKILSDFGFREVLGVDIGSDSIAKANLNFSSNQPNRIIEFQQQNAENLFTDKQFDFLLCTEVIEHTENPAKVVENIKKLLKPQGIAIITLPNKISLSYFLVYLVYNLKNRPISSELQNHLDYPFYKSMKLFRNSNLKILKTTGTNLFFIDAMFPFLTKISFFPLLNRINFYLSRIFPFSYFSQFFFIVLKNETPRL
jgi:ubiquinone biosynthesis O-methyltransferase